MPNKPEHTEQGWRYPVDSNRHHRENGWDYYGHAIYHITLVVAERQHLFGELIGNSADTAKIELNSFGLQVHRLLRDTPKYYQPKGYALKMLAFKIMPDHLHFVIQVLDRLPKPIGTVVRGFKSACTSLFKRTYFSGDDTNNSQIPSVIVHFVRIFADTGSIWEKTPAGYHERILHAEGQLNNMISYVHDNPRRLWLKKKRPEYFAVQHNVQWNGHSFSIVGNILLLDSSLWAVHVRSRFSEEEAHSYMHECIVAARKGAVLVGAFISPKEKQVLEMAVAEGLPVIFLVPYSFSEYYKPTGKLIEMCTKGKMLFLTEVSSEVSPRRSISREECNTLNALAEEMMQTTIIK
ncbi:MAG: hypothetical protein II575_04640 [Bacteroidales bacterium]|nr:hypothetical protein [Bacteroidales bacterium]